jgi:PAS domain S-box-containing protein
MTARAENISTRSALSKDPVSRPDFSDPDTGQWQKPPALSPVVRYLPGAAGIFVIVVGFLVLAGWAFDIEVLRNIAPGFAAMKPNTALGFILAGFSLCLLHDPDNRSNLFRRSTGRIFAISAGVIGGITLLQYILNWDSGFDVIFFKDKLLQESNKLPGRMSLVTAVNFFLSAISLLFLNFQTKGGLRPYRWLSAFVLIVSLLSILGYVYNAQALYETFAFSTIAIHTAISFFVFSSGLLFTRGEKGLVGILLKDSPGGTLARRLLPAAILLPFLFRALRMWGEGVGLFGNEFGLTIFSLTNVFVFTFLIWRTSASLDQTDKERQRATRRGDRSIKELNDMKFAIDEAAIVAFTDQTGKITFVNDKFCEISGYEREELLGQDHRIINSAYHPKEFIRNIWTTISNGNVWHGEIKNRAKNGSFYWVDTTIVPFLNEKGKPYQYVAIRNDITDRKRSAEQYIRLAAIVESSEDSIIGTDMNGVITSWNQGAERMFGYRAEEMIGRNKAILVPTDSLYQLADELKIAQSGKQVQHTEAERIKKDKTTVTVSVTTSLIKDYDGKVTGVSFIARDITEKKLADAALQESRAQMATIVENLDEGVVVADLKGNLLHINPSALKMYGFDTIDKFFNDSARFYEIFELSTMDGRVVELDGWPLAQVLGNKILQDLEMGLCNRETGWARVFSYTGSLVHDSKGDPLLAVITIRDITERKKAEDELKNNEHRFRALIEHGSDSISLIDKDNKILYLSPSVKTVEGYEPEELLGHSGIEHTHPDDLPFVQKVVDEMLENPGTPIPVTWRRQHKNGNWMWLEGVATNLLDDPAIGAIVTNYRDITERRAAEEELRESEERYRLLFENNPFPMWVYDLETLKFLAVNDAAILSYGYSRAEFMAMTIKDIRPDEDLPALLENIAQPHERIDGPDIWRHRKKNGAVISVEVTSHELVFVGRLSRLVLVNDVTERKFAEQKLQESQKQFRELTESLPQLVWTCRGEDGSCDYVSPQWLYYTGLPMERHLGFGWVDQVHPEDREGAVATWNRSVLLAKVYDTEFRIRRRDGNYRWFKTRAIPFKDKDGKILKWIGTNTDIEDSRRAGEEIRELNETLEQRVADRTLELEAANKELESFSYSVSHDLRAPLRAIDGFSQALLEDYMEKLDDDGKNHLMRVRAGSQRMANLIDDMLALSRLTRAEMIRKTVDLSKLTREISDQLYESAPHREVVFHIQSDVEAFGDERLLRIALENLLGNAWKFTSKCERSEISFGRFTDSGKTEYFIRDNGAGFDMAYADKLFGAFQRLHSNNEFEGTGIGLATVQRIIHRHGGRIRAESKVGEGTTFYFML